ncbi:hypothetical protein DID88_003159 [Monilinia fructigena]|uniref:N-acetyltransferase domain-containing protein n=1 Tax=Monilinia fructigena TaxID=38457 RepID=A0A395IV01_9HELO|nr:hypothetical protein DID88_003159 [Monilinia fructigena]
MYEPPLVKFIEGPRLDVRILNNYPLNDSNNRLPDDASWKDIDSDSQYLISTFTKRHIAAQTDHNALSVLVEEDGKIVGIGVIHELEHQPRLANIGTILEAEGRGHGVSKVLMKLLLRLSNELDVDAVEAGTFKGNVAMRRLMRSLGVEETDEEKIMPGDRKVAEVMFKDIGRERWKNFEFGVEFLGVVD